MGDSYTYDKFLEQFKDKRTNNEQQASARVGDIHFRGLCGDSRKVKYIHNWGPWEWGLTLSI